jgi:hypothetical protein
MAPPLGEAVMYQVAAEVERQAGFEIAPKAVESAT